MIYNIFISYETLSGRNYAEHLKKALEKSKNPEFKVFLASEDIMEGEWKKKIDRSIEESNFFYCYINYIN
ncbi:TIR domain-containing protein [Methanobacterium paludis]|uniref:TIR domain-containing protein n=1 Tax=Methanobacterium paludis (strain DSM 25820 / JCM 18151 / SWAN1) TaxID=868131 RepID=F6D3U2_METPW|nr:TIR domain-containing protein [Methanobacterium paludis]AEG18744.1 hypothetical protein MSWAN_1733 [Methanobacterium paludis]